MTTIQPNESKAPRRRRRYEKFVSDPDHDVLRGAKNIGAVINVSAKFVYSNWQELGLTKIGPTLFGSRRKLLDRVGGA